MVFNILVCLFLGGSLLLFIRNNNLFAYGGHNLRHPAVLVMLAVLGIPFLLGLYHMLRRLWRQHRPPS